MFGKQHLPQAVADAITGTVLTVRGTARTHAVALVADACGIYLCHGVSYLVLNDAVKVELLCTSGQRVELIQPDVIIH
jgi:hypothetical protein